MLFYDYIETSLYLTDQQKEWLYYILESMNLWEKEGLELYSYLKAQEKQIEKYVDEVTDKSTNHLILAKVKGNKTKEIFEHIKKLEENDQDELPDIETAF